MCPDVLHLSGDIEGITPAQVQELRDRFPGLKIMQAIPVLAGVPLEEQKVMQYIKDYEPVTDFFLIDTKAPEAGDIGATGLTHDRMIDKAIVESTKVPCIIAGGPGCRQRSRGNSYHTSLRRRFLQLDQLRR